MGSEPGEVVSPPHSPLRIGSEAPTLPSKEGGGGKKGESPSAVVGMNPGLTEAREEEHTLTCRYERAGTSQALLALHSELTQPCRSKVQRTVYQGDTLLRDDYYFSPLPQTRISFGGLPRTLPGILPTPVHEN